MTYTKKIYKTARDTLNFFLWFCWTKSIKKIHIDLRCARARGPQGTYKARTSEINFILSKVQKWQFLPPHEKFWAKSWKYPKSYAFVIYKWCLFANMYIGQKFKKSPSIWITGQFGPCMGPVTILTHPTQSTMVKEVPRPRILNFVIFGWSDHSQHSAYFC